MGKSKSEAKADGKKYVVVIGINYSTPQGEKRAEPGEIVDDLPSRAVRGLLDAGAISEEKQVKAPDPVEE